MVMLDRYADDSTVIVAHFNHGTRPSADEDQHFVQRQSIRYHKPFFTTKQVLGSNVTEETARLARYRFLEQIAREQHAEIYTAHHQDDLLESIAINLLRGTGWRGLVPLDRNSVHRPLLNLSKKDIVIYAAEHRICFRQDPTNVEEHYLRNRLRPIIANLPTSVRQQLLRLYHSQKTCKQEVDQLIAHLLPPDRIYQRSWFNEADDIFILEFLRAALVRANLSATRPQLQDFLQAIRTYAPGKKFNLPGNHLVTMYKSYFKL